MGPRSLAEVADAVRMAERVVIGRALPGGPADGTGVTLLDLRELAGPLEINPDNLSATFLAGTVIADVQAALAPHGLWWPVDAAPHRTLGAVLATAGPYPSRTGCGPVRDWVLGMEVILAGGVPMRLGGTTMKNVAGYDLTRLMVGSQGTLGAIGVATLRLLPKPERQVTICLAQADWMHVADLATACEWDGARLLVRVDGREAQVARRLMALGGEPAPQDAWDDWYAKSEGRYTQRREPNWSAVGAPLLGLWRTDEAIQYSPLEVALREAIAPNRCFNPHLK
jgi:glycolate oxidase FAD binding subunit